MSNGPIGDSPTFGNGGGITSNIILMEPKAYRRVQEDAIQFLDRIGVAADDTLRKALGLDNLSPAE